MPYRNDAKTRIGALLLAASFTALFGGCGSKSAEEYMRDAAELRQKGDRVSAILQLKNAVQQEPTNAKVRFLLGSAYNELRDGASAEKELRKALELGLIEGGRVTAELARALVLERKFAPVVDGKEIQPLPAYEPGAVATILAMRSRAYLATRRLKEAQIAAEGSAAAKSDSLDALHANALVMAAQRKVDPALESIDRTLGAHPGDFEGWMIKADLLRMKENPDLVLAVYQKLLEMDPKFLPALGARAALYITVGKTAEAQRDVATIIKITPNHPSATYLQAIIHLRSGRYQDAQAAIQQVLRVMPNYPPAILMAGSIQYALGSFVQAQRYLSVYLRIDPSNVYARKLLASTMIELNEGRRALEVIQPMLGRELQDATVLALAGDAYLKAGDLASANPYLAKAVAIDPNNPNLLTRSALGRLGAGDIANAIAELEKASGLDVNKFDADQALIMTHLVRGDFDLAVEAIGVLRKKLPNSPDPLNYLGAAYLGKKDRANARKSFEQALAIDPGNFPAAVNLADLDLQDKKPADARKRLEGVLVKNPKSVAAMMALARLSAGLGNLPEYVKWLEQAAKASTGSAEPQLELAGYFLAAGQPKRALEAALDAQRVAPNDPKALDAVGLTQMANGDKESALSTFALMTKVAPRSALGYYRTASTLIMVNNLAGAVTALKTALELQPDFLLASDSLGKLLLMQGKLDEAAKIAKQIQQQHRNTAAGYMLEGDVLMSGKKYPEALKVYEAAAARGASGPLTIKTYAALARNGKAAAGEEVLRRWLKDHPNDASVRHTLADAYQQNGLAKQAIEQYEAIVKTSPNDWIALNNLANLHQDMQDRPRALEVAERAFLLQPANAQVADTLGWLVLQSGDTKRGLQLLEKAASQGQKVPGVRYHFAVALAKSGDKTRAKKELEQLIATGDQFRELEDAKTLLKQL